MIIKVVFKAGRCISTCSIDSRGFGWRRFRLDRLLPCDLLITKNPLEQIVPQQYLVRKSLAIIDMNAEPTQCLTCSYLSWHHYFELPSRICLWSKRLSQGSANKVFWYYYTSSSVLLTFQNQKILILYQYLS